MPILNSKVSWSKPRKSRGNGYSTPLTADEQGNVRRAIRTLKYRYETVVDLAKALGTSRGTVTHLTPKRAVTADLAYRVGRLAGVTIDDVLTGAWPKAGACPMCGRCGE